MFGKVALQITLLNTHAQLKQSGGASQGRTQGGGGGGGGGVRGGPDPPANVVFKPGDQPNSWVPRLGGRGTCTCSCVWYHMGHTDL